MSCQGKQNWGRAGDGNRQKGFYDADVDETRRFSLTTAPFGEA